MLAPLLARFGARLEVEVARRGFNPQGGGELRVRAGLLSGERLRAVDLSVRYVYVYVYVFVYVLYL